MYVYNSEYICLYANICYYIHIYMFYIFFNDDELSVDLVLQPYRAVLRGKQLFVSKENF